MDDNPEKSGIKELPEDLSSKTRFYSNFGSIKNLVYSKMGDNERSIKDLKGEAL